MTTLKIILLLTGINWNYYHNPPFESRPLMPRLKYFQRYRKYETLCLERFEHERPKREESRTSC